jgi:hypothetical protein
MANETFGYVLTPDISGGNPRTANDATQKQPLGSLYRWKGDTYMYVKFDDGAGNVAAEDGAVVYWKTFTPSAATPVLTVTTDQSDALGASVNSVAGVLGGVITDGNFCWIQVSGRKNGSKTAASVAIGDMLIGSATDKEFARVAAGVAPTNIVFGRALSAVSGGKSDVLLMNLLP